MGKAALQRMLVQRDQSVRGVFLALKTVYFILHRLDLCIKLFACNPALLWHCLV